MKTGYELWLDMIHLARLVGEFDGAWITLELLHLIELRRHEILAASDEATACALFDEIFDCLDSWTDETALADEVRERLLCDPPLLADAPESALTEGRLSKERSEELA